MADLEGIIRLRKHKLDEKRRALAELNDQLDRLQKTRDKLEEDLAREQEVAAGGEDGAVLPGWGFGNYLKTVLNRREQIDEAMRQLERRIEAAREDIRDAFAELKKYEITQRERERRAREEEERKETEELDAIGIEGYRRRDEAE